ncbi:glycosyltransferase family 39 protein [Acidobacterium sp. S8]|uniref:ArnT family glycosyltransferase n=1 Tax=Acidobacterium sp. S8 TaxID=1641854 RepID=UPI0020B14251|nr:glycosyltransferase family 39 protein [Acidobacterium sp. S8]
MAVIESTETKKRIDWKSPWTMFWVALLVRVLYITITRSYRFHTFNDHFEFGWEMGRISRALAIGRGYADPFVSNTGPTAWNPPLYPLILAAVFKIFGVYTKLSGWAILCVNSVFSAATVPAVYEIAKRCYAKERNGASIAQWSGWLWALYPAAMQYAVRWVWEMTLTTMLFAWVLVIALRMRGVGDDRERNTLPYWLLFGLVWAGVALSNPSPLLMLPICGLWIVFGAKNKAAAIRGAVLGSIVFWACLMPWIVRNWHVFHTFIPIRGNLGAELYAGNGPGSEGFPWGGTLPIIDGANRIAVYREMGEVRYVKMQGDKAKAYIRAHREHFLKISLKRFYFYWVGVPHSDERQAAAEYLREINYSLLSFAALLGLWLSWRRRIPASGLFAWAFLLLPISYYFVTPGARFRHPLEPLITVFCVFLFQAAEKSWRVRWVSR